MNQVLAEEALQLPAIDYAALAPMLILFGAACVGVLVEAFVPPRRPLPGPVDAGPGWPGRRAGRGRADWRARALLTAGVALAIDGPALFLQGAILVLGVVSLLLIGERSVERGGAFVAQAAVTAETRSRPAQAPRVERARPRSSR